MLNLKKKILLVFCCCSSLSLYAQEQFDIDSKFNWQNQQIIISLNIPIDDFNTKSRQFAENVIKTNFLSWISRGMSELVIDSKNKMIDYFEQSTASSPRNELLPLLQRNSAIFAPDFKTYTANYSIDMFPEFIKLWVGQSVLKEIPLGINEASSMRYSGLIIYAKDKLPLHGTSISGYLSPALLPRIFNQDMNLLINHERIKKAYLFKWGIASYIDKVESFYTNERVGSTPLRIEAVSIFGINNSDIIISNDDAKLLISNVETRNILSEGRILIIYNNENSAQQAQDSFIASRVEN